MNYVVQAKPEDLTQISERFKKQEEAVGATRQSLVRMHDRLKQGWIGLGSEAYFAEAERLVLPAVQRLENALGEAARTVNSVTDTLGTAEKEASSPFQEATNSASSGAAATQQAPAQQGAGAAAAGGGAGGQLGSRVQSGGFGSGAADLASRGADLGRSTPPFASMASPSSWLSTARASDPFRSAVDPFSRTPFESTIGEGFGGSGGGSSGGGSGSGGGGGGGSLGSVLGALRGQAGSGFGLGGTATGGVPELTFSGMGGFGGSGGPQPMDFGVPLAIAAASPFAALLGQVVKDRAKND